jgi:23S rRNA (uracil1939-C5)-methyltransferase
LLLGEPVLGAQCPLRPEITLYLRPDLFSQASAEGDAALARAVLECLTPGPGDRILELFGGSGNLTFPIASDASTVTCVERSNAALELARRSAREGRVENVRFLQGEAARICRGLVQEGVRFDKLLVDPPRGGAKGVASWAEALGAKELVYVGCDAAALARDALALGKVGFAPRALHLIDMFPQTHHAELVMSFEREAALGPGPARPSLPAKGG